jgi:hypothetical protein
MVLFSIIETPHLILNATYLSNDTCYQALIIRYQKSNTCYKKFDTCYPTLDIGNLKLNICNPINNICNPINNTCSPINFTANPDSYICSQKFDTYNPINNTDILTVLLFLLNSTIYSFLQLILLCICHPESFAA